MLKLYNTLTRKKEVFRPLEDNLVRIYTCGPTVYDYAHIGNFRAYVFADLLKRYLKFRGYRVKHVMNITDVDDKTIKYSKEKGVSLKEYREKYKKAFFEDLAKLNIEKADVFPEATKHIKDMVKLIEILIKKGYAYKAKDGSVYYDISKFKDYGKLARINLKDLKAGARVRQDSYEKQEAYDFALWKSYSKEDGDVFWETSIGKGRPGWHIECSAMSMKYLGESFDIHTGGIDLVFPHHTNEIAQSEAATGKRFVNFWLHNEWLLVNGKKMSKSLGNFYTLRDILKKGYNPLAVRYLLLSTHYRQQLNFTFEALKSAERAVERINNFVFMLKQVRNVKNSGKIKGLIKKTREDFIKKMDDDLNISEALAVVFDFIKKVNKIKIGKEEAKMVLEFVKELDSVLGILEKREVKLSEEVKRLVKERELARKNKDFKRADEIREKLKKMGYILEDSEGGTIVKIVR